MKLTIPCSPEQEDIIADHLIYKKELGVLPDERAWMLSYARKKYPACRILGANLDLENACWELELQIHE